MRIKIKVCSVNGDTAFITHWYGPYDEAAIKDIDAYVAADDSLGKPGYAVDETWIFAWDRASGWYWRFQGAEDRTEEALPSSY